MALPTAGNSSSWDPSGTTTKIQDVFSGIGNAFSAAPNVAATPGQINQADGGLFGFGSQGPWYDPGTYNNQALNNMVANPNAGAQAAVSNPYLSGILGQGGALQDAQNQAKDLQATGFSLQPQDYQAYGQAQNQAAQMFGQQGSSLANSLSQRGFGGGGGVAGAQFSGVLGNKNEQLAAAQAGIADQRMKFAQTALNNTRQSMAQMAGLGNDYAGLYNKNQGDAANAYNTGYKYQNDAGYNAAEQKGNSKTPTLGQMFGSGLGSSAASIGNSPGRVSNAFSDSLGKGLGMMSGGAGG